MTLDEQIAELERETGFAIPPFFRRVLQFASDRIDALERDVRRLTAEALREKGPN